MSKVESSGVIPSLHKTSIAAARYRQWGTPVAQRTAGTLMLRISQALTADAQITLRLEGEINGRWVEELQRECARALDAAAPDGRRLVLDLADVSSIDASGLELFRKLRTRRVILTNCSLYVAELLNQSKT